jgi:hypothetical protein
MTATECAALNGRLARAHGYAQDARATAAHAEKAFILRAESDPAQDPDWIYWCDEADLSGMVGEGYLALGDSLAASPYLKKAIDGLADTRPRDRALWMLSLASAHFQGGHREEALDVARHATGLVAHLKSDRVVARLGDFRRQLGPATTPDVVDFDDCLHATLPHSQHSMIGVA